MVGAIPDAPQSELQAAKARFLEKQVRCEGRDAGVRLCSVAGSSLPAVQQPPPASLGQHDAYL